MSAEWGTLREPTIPVPDVEQPSDVQARAARSSPGTFDEDLGRYGSEPWRLPGYGDSGPKCGIWYPDAVCDECGNLSLNTHRCGRRSCPECWTTWAKESSVRATVRVQSYRYVQPDNHRRQIAHAVVSASEGDVMNEREFFDGKSKAADIAKEKGFRGFSIIAHPWRVTDEGKRRYRAEDVDVGIWVWLRNNHDESELKELIYWSPHYHIIGSTSASMEPAKDGDEWVYNWIRSFDRFDGAHDEDSHEEVYGAYRYLLSHTGYPDDSTKQAVTWYGDLANAVFVDDATQDHQIAKPSHGVQSVIKRLTESLAGVCVDEDGDGGDDTDDVGDCPRTDCDGVLIDVLDVDRYLRHNEPPPDVAHRMETALDWRLGRSCPPPGLKQPTCEEDALLAFDEML